MRAGFLLVDFSCSANSVVRSTKFEVSGRCKSSEQKVSPGCRTTGSFAFQSATLMVHVGGFPAPGVTLWPSHGVYDP